AEVEHGQEGGLLWGFRPGGRGAGVISASRTGARLVEVGTGRVLAALEPPEPAPILGLAFSPDGRHLAVAQSDQRVHIWDLATIRRELDVLGLAAGIPDVFGGATAGEPSAVDRVEGDGAGPAGPARLAVPRGRRQARGG